MSLSLRISTVIACLRRAAPYLAIELILPGGSLIALTLWILRNRRQLRQRFLERTGRHQCCERLSATRNATRLDAARPKALMQRYATIGTA